MSIPDSELNRFQRSYRQPAIQTIPVSSHPAQAFYVEETLLYFLFYRLLERLRLEGSHRGGAALCEEAHATIARSKGTIAGCDHPATGLGARSSPDVGAQGRAHHAEMDGVRGPGGSAEGHTGQNDGRPVHLLLHDQAGPIDKSLVPVIAIRPAQHSAKVAAAKGAQRGARIHLGVSSCGS